LNLWKSAVFIALTSVAPLAADAVYVQRDSPLFPYGSVAVTGDLSSSRSGTFSSGIFGLKSSANSGGPYAPFWAVCVDANQNLFSGTQLYFREDLDAYTSILPNTDPPAPPLTPARMALLEQAYFVGWADAQTSATKSSAFQWMIWNIARDTDMTVTSGDVKITGSGDDDLVEAQANTYLASITAATPRMDLVIWSPVQLESNGTYTRVAGQELLTPVPEPGYFAIAGAGLTWLIVRLRSRASAA
jgi:hypothetical protein